MEWEYDYKEVTFKLRGGLKGKEPKENKMKQDRESISGEIKQTM